MHRNLMVGIYFCLSLLVVTVTSAGAATVRANGYGATGYVATITYSGSFRSNTLYFRPRPNGDWYPGLRGNYPGWITCQDALTSLNYTGLWRGAIQKNGACLDSDEPGYWAMGNRLNFDGVKIK